MSDHNITILTRPLSIVYILLYFPYFTETFIADEISALKSQGCDVQIISLLKPKKTPIQPLSKKLLKYTSYTPGLFSFNLWKAQFFFLRRSRSLYFRLLNELLASPVSKKTNSLIDRAKRILIFLKSVFIAYQLKDRNDCLFHTHFAWLSGLSSLICSSLLKRPFTITIHAFDIYAKPDLLKLILGQAAHIVSISEYNKSYITRKRLCSVNSVSVIHCGLNLNEIKYQKKIDYLPNKPIKILSIGSLTPKKGHKDLIRACWILKLRGFKFTCTIIGGGKEETELRNLIISYGLQKQIFLTGAITRPDILEAYSTHDLFVLASIKAPNGDMDGIPVVLMEAAAVGLPLISTSISGIPELIKHYKTGLLVPPTEPSLLAEAIFTLALNQKLQTTVSKNARNLIESEFNQKLNIKKLIQLFYSI